MQRIFRLICFMMVILCVGCNRQLANSSTPTTETKFLLSGGELRFALDKALTSETGNKPAQGCWPSTYFDDGSGYLSISKAGEVEGRCGWTSPSEINPQVTWNNTGQLLGKFNNQTKEVTFRLDAQAEYPELGTIIKNVFEASGFMTSSMHAEGEANFSSTCQSTTDEPRCGVDSNGLPRSSWSVTGNVPWTIDFSP